MRMGQVALSLIAPQDEQWDDVVLVQYPSRAAFLGMLQLEEYKAAARPTAPLPWRTHV